jgi:hypothetical protein
LTEEFMRPLLHIGYHKTGTTWLQKRVFNNTEAGFFRIKGPGTLPYFVVANPFDFKPGRIRKKVEPEMRKAQARNLVPVLSWERLSGMPHSGGYDSKTIADRLAATFPNARVLIVIREQTSMLLSVYKQYVRDGGAATFRQYVTTPPGPPQMPSFRFDFYEYHRLIGYYQDLFGATNVLVLPYELLRTQPDTFLERIGEFVGVPATPSGLDWRNVAPSALALSLKRHANRYLVLHKLNPAPPFAFRGSHQILQRACRKVDEKVPAALRDRYELRWRRYAEREVGTRYAESNALTAKLTGLDLRAFGYACG